MKLVNENNKIEILKMYFENQTNLLRFLTQIDLQILTGYLTLQLFFGSWIATREVADFSTKVGLIIINITISFAAGKLLYNNYRRRIEVAETVQNLNEALEFGQKGTYLAEKVLNAPTRFRPWWYWYIVIVSSGALAISILLFS